jgi:hypothetical protein
LVSRQWAEQGVNNLEAAELGLRAALLKDGRTLLEKLVQSAADSVPQAQAQKGEKCHADRPRSVDTIFGSIDLKRDYLYSPKDHQGCCPLDQALGLIDGTSPGLVRLASRAAAREGFEAASDDLKELAGIHIAGRQIQRLVAHSGPRVAAQLKLTGPEVEAKPMPICHVEADGTGIPMMAEELEGCKGKQQDGTAKTRVKLDASSRRPRPTRTDSRCATTGQRATSELSNRSRALRHCCAMKPGEALVRLRRLCSSGTGRPGFGNWPERNSRWQSSFWISTT